MKTFLEILLRMSAYGSIAVLLVLMLRFLFRKLPKKTVVLFWIVAAIRLVCPLNFETPVSLLNLAPQDVISSLEPTEPDDEVSDEGTALESGESDMLEYGKLPVMSRIMLTTDREDGGRQMITVSDTSANNLSEVIEGDLQTGILSGSTPNDTKFPIFSVVFIIWILGATAVVLYVVVGFMRTNRLITRLFRRSGRYLESERINTPFVYGIFNPKICVPVSLDVSEKDYMLLHEQIHIKNHDALIKAFAIIVLCLHWFNPLVWVAVRLCMSDLEMRCDEEVVDVLGEKIRRNYCLSIVNHATADTGIRVFTTAFAQKSISRMEIKMRIKNLINYKKVSKFRTMTILAAVLTATFMLTSCAESIATDTSPRADDEIPQKAVISEYIHVGGEDDVVGIGDIAEGGSIDISGVVGDDSADIGDVVEERISYSITVDSEGNKTVSSSAPLTVWTSKETPDGETEITIYGDDKDEVNVTLEKDEEGDEGVVVFKYNRVYDEGLHETESSNGDKLLSRTCEGADFESLDEFKAFYSYKNINNVLDGVYEPGDPRVKVASWSRFTDEATCNKDIFEDKNNCYILTRKLDDGTTHFRLIYDCSTHDITRLENVIASLITECS